MNETTETETDPNEPLWSVLDLVTRHQQADRDFVQSITDSIIIDAKARGDAITDGVIAALDTEVWGGTTAQYDDTLRRVAAALHPPTVVLDRYKARAERWLRDPAGDHDEPIILADRKFGGDC